MTKKFSFLISLILCLTNASVAASENNYQGMLIICDQSDYYDSQRPVSATTLQLGEALMTQKLFILASQEVLYNYGKQALGFAQQQLAENFIVKQHLNMYLLIPKALLFAEEIRELDQFVLGSDDWATPLELKYGLWLQHLRTVHEPLSPSYNNFNSLAQQPSYETQIATSSHVFPNVLHNVFIPHRYLSPHLVWNIEVIGHGSTSNQDFPSVTGLTITAFKELLTFFRKQLQIKTLYLVSCFIMGKKDSLFSYNNMNAVLEETYPFTIATENIGETLSTALIPLNNNPIFTQKITPTILCKNQLQSEEDYFDLRAKTGILEIDENFIQIRYKNTDTFLPLLNKNNKKYFAITNVMAQQERESLIIPEETELILLYTDQLKFPLIIKNFKNNPVRIVSMLAPTKIPHLKKVIFDSTPQKELESFWFLFAPRFTQYLSHEFLIDEMVFTNSSRWLMPSDTQQSFINLQQPLSLISIAVNAFDIYQGINSIYISAYGKDMFNQQKTIFCELIYNPRKTGYSIFTNNAIFNLSDLITQHYIHTSAYASTHSPTTEQVFISPLSSPSFEKRLITSLQKNKTNRTQSYLMRSVENTANLK